MFYIRYADASNNLIERALTPAPNAVDYPDQALYKILTTQDGNVIVQRPLRDARPRKWTWRGYGQPDADYVALWSFLQSMSYRARMNQALTPTIDIWEDTTGSGGFDKLDSLGNKVYTTVKVLQVTRTPSGPGPMRYESSITFYIEDENYDAF